jgi:hypothetical protein
MSWKKEEERENMPFIVATYVSACSQGQRTHSGDIENSGVLNRKMTGLTDLLWTQSTQISMPWL